MPVLKPFKAIRPPRDKAHLVASRSYISYPKEELSEKLGNNPFTFLHIINPEASEGTPPTRNTLERFKKVRRKFDEWKAKSYFVREDFSAFYIYQQTYKEHSYCGILGCASTADYQNGKIKIHEHTLTDREEVFTSYLQETAFHAEPVLLTFPRHEGLGTLIARYQSEYAELDFSTTDEHRHQVWPVTNPADVKAIEEYFLTIDDFYIADGHHRSASSSRLAQLLNEKNGNNPNAAHNYFLTCLVPDSELRIAPFHRLIQDLNGQSAEELITNLNDTFGLKECATPEEAKPEFEHQIGMYLGGKWYSFFLKEVTGTVAEKLNTQQFTVQVLEPVFGIKDLKTDKRIACTDGSGGAKTIEKMVNGKKFEVGFWLYPISTAQVMEVADNKEVMPPKSTWVEPKLRSGLTVFTFESGETL